MEDEADSPSTRGSLELEPPPYAHARFRRAVPTVEPDEEQHYPVSRKELVPAEELPAALDAIHIAPSLAVQQTKQDTHVSSARFARTCVRPPSSSRDKSNDRESIS